MRERAGILVGLAAVVVFGLGRVFPHSATLQGALWACPLKTITEVPCPACGSTRVAVHLAHARLGEALALAPLPAVILLGALAVGAWAAVQQARRRAGPEPILRRLWAAKEGRLAVVATAALLYAYALWHSAVTGTP